jgi:hypothetical protein
MLQFNLSLLPNVYTPYFSKSNHKVSKHIQLPNLKEKFIHYLKIWLWDLGHCWAVILVAQTLPVIEDRYEDAIDHYLKIAADEVHKHYKTMEATFLSKIPKAPVLSEKEMM